MRQFDGFGRDHCESIQTSMFRDAFAEIAAQMPRDFEVGKRQRKMHKNAYF